MSSTSIVPQLYIRRWGCTGVVNTKMSEHINLCNIISEKEQIIFKTHEQELKKEKFKSHQEWQNDAIFC